MCYYRHICLVILIGIPGSGKSHFRKFLESFFTENFESILGSVQLCSVCYDDYCSVKKPHLNSKWKNERLNVVKVVDNIISYFKEHNLSVKDFSKKFPGICLVNAILQKPNSTLIVIDDNMYYRSMRYEYYKLAKMYNISFSQIFFDIKLEEALKFNNNRIETRVPDSVIETMFCKIEHPDKSKSWESNSVQVLSPTNFTCGNVLKEIFSCIKVSLENPLKSINENAKNTTSSNALHQIDNVLKQIVNHSMRNNIKEREKSELMIMSKYYSEKRHELLKQIKEGRVVLAVDLDKPIDKEKIDYVKSALSVLLLK